MNSARFSAWPTVRVTAAATLAVLVMGGLSACGSSNGGSTDATTPTTTSASLPGGPQFDPSQLEAIQQCLKAAGITQRIPSGGRPTGQLPSGGIPSGGFPSGTPPTGGLPGGGGLNNAKAKAALKACGLSLPSLPQASP